MRRRLPLIFELLITIAYSLILGIYVNILSEELREARFPTALLSMGSWNLLAVGAAAILYLHFRLFDNRVGKTELERKAMVERILENACKSLGYSEFGELLHVRAIVTMLDAKGDRRVTKYAHNVLIDPEKAASYRADFGVTGEALVRKVPVVRKLEPEHIFDYDYEHRDIVAPELRCVLAAPIFSPHKTGKVIGVLAFDSFEDLSHKFESRDYREIAQAWANVLAEIVG